MKKDFEKEKDSVKVIGFLYNKSNKAQVKITKRTVYLFSIVTLQTIYE